MKKFTPLHLLLTLLALTVIEIVSVLIIVAVVTSNGMPSLYDLENPPQKYATQIYSADGEILDHFYLEKRVPLTYSEIPRDFVNALVATEDRRFWEHWGVHVGRIFNSAIKNVFAGRTKEGASTITMQLARNLYLNREVNFTRKIREAATAVQIERTYTKEEIMEMYCNAVDFGRGAFGLRIAAKQYFNKQPKELTTSECAFLVGLLKKPGYYNRVEHYDDAIARRNVVLYCMQEEGYITNSNYVKSTQEPISFMQTGITKDKELLRRRMQNMGIAPHFVETLRQSIRDDANIKGEYNFYTDGLTIHTTLDSRIQKALNRAVDAYLPKIQADFNKNYSWSRNQSVLNKILEKHITSRIDYKEANSAKKQLIKSKLMQDKHFIDSIKNIVSTVQCGIVVIDISNGAIVGMVGSSPKAILENPDAKYSLNHAVQIRRQPGSSFKPFVYASALQKGMTPTSTIESGPYTYTLPSGETWSPSGYGKDSAGVMTLTQALTASVNTASARLITQKTTPGDVVALAQKAGIKSNLQAVPALSLGAGGEVSPLELIAAYEIFANNGVFNTPYLYERIEDRNGEIITERNPAGTSYDVIEKEIAEQMTYMMQQVVQYGTATRVRTYLQNIDAAGKTGTTNDAADAWFIGYTPQLVCGIWLGFDDLRINFNCLGAVGYGGRIAAPLWGAIMKEIYDIPNLPYKQKKFASIALDSADTNKSNKLPYRLTPTQMQNSNNENPPVDDDIKRNTYLDGAFLDNKKRKN